VVGSLKPREKDALDSFYPYLDFSDAGLCRSMQGRFAFAVRKYFGEQVPVKTPCESSNFEVLGKTRDIGQCA